jgi:hypothetical protein
MSQIEQGRSAGRPAVRGRSRLGAVSRRAVGYFVDPAGPGGDAPGDQDTAEFTPDDVAVADVLPLTRSGGYEREAVDRRLAALERELAAARAAAAAAAPRGVEAEIRYLGEETSEILRLAHDKAEKLVARATAEAADLRAAARADADATTQAAERRLRELDGETELIWAERARLTDDTMRLAEALRGIAESAVGRFPPAAEEEPAPPPAGPCLDEPPPAPVAVSPAVG